ncbi:MAG: FKBP-type peptidyl-prolyl cis-trans isomerase [Segetibacter sp.]|jgi:FKBP-type peptidyl-prolyl cis-trans isomerase FklB|nr:FKBP-type peptidyl-prolyl cis-trans isomerase [Segetibacter sp.]
MSLFDKLNKAKEDKSVSNLQAGEDFLAENATRPEVTTTASGLQYEVLTEGNGPKPQATNTVTCHYHGTLTNGTVFDSSVQRGQPASFPLNGVIKGWTEALQLMSVGSKYRLFLHPSLAYGEKSAGAHIQPNSTLIFDVELLSIR